MAVFARTETQAWPALVNEDHVPNRQTGEKHNPRVEQTITVGIGFAVIGIYVWLMAVKWLPV